MEQNIKTFPCMQYDNTWKRSYNFFEDRGFLMYILYNVFITTLAVFSPSAVTVSDTLPGSFVERRITVAVPL